MYGLKGETVLEGTTTTAYRSIMLASARGCTRGCILTYISPSSLHASLYMQQQSCPPLANYMCMGHTLQEPIVFLPNGTAPVCLRLTVAFAVQNLALCCSSL